MKVKGSISFYFLILISFIVVVAFTSSTILIGGYNIISTKINAEQAYYNAEAGIILAEKYLSSSQNNNFNFSKHIINQKFDDNNSVKVEVKNDTLAKKIDITSTGFSNRYKKTIEKYIVYSKK